MIQGLHIATQGMTTLMQKQDQIANNLANVNTTGFKQSGLFARAYQKYLDDDQQRVFANREVKADEAYIDYREGPSRKTGNTLDLAIRGSGFFTVMSPNGVRYTRNGNFSLNPDGFLINTDGAKVMGREGYIRIDKAKEPVTVTATGKVLQGDEEVGVLKISDFKKPYRLIREGGGAFRPRLPDNPPIESSGFQIKQGFLEGSNVNAIRNMARMITTYRNFEADQRALMAQNETLDKAVNQVGRVQ
ncbi:MAG: flagellar basal-body rod protein FlgF [Chitinivibrionales bacterium]|nr:flagellar basal-body rod protein FlgF [Chitinivibrionales bacterium]MBD3357954.1 flagellar basal-body rod protein FlgF [Chitinivibrionales bacterium]